MSPRKKLHAGPGITPRPALDASGSIGGQRPATGRWMLLPFLFVLLCCLNGCETERYRHDTPPGQGTLIVDNQSWDRLDVYVNGVETNRVRSFEYECYDLDPDVYRVVLMDRDGRRSHRSDVDILEKRRTVMRVRRRDGYDGYDVTVFFD